MDFLPEVMTSLKNRGPRSSYKFKLKSKTQHHITKELERLNRQQWLKHPRAALSEEVSLHRD